MEDWLYISLAIGFIASAALKNRKRPARPLQEAEEEVELPEQWRTLEEFFPELKRPTSKQAPRTEVLHPDSQESLTPLADRPKRAKKAQKAKPTSHTSLHSAQGAQSSAHTPKEPTEAPLPAKPHPDMEDFSLRKAVIWSEILKPKFDEE